VVKEIKGMEKIKILWVGDAVVPTGFARVNHSILKHLPKDKYDVYFLGVNYWGDPHNYPYKIYPAGTGKSGDFYGFYRIPQFAKEKFDLIFFLNDTWIIAEYLKAIKDTWKEGIPKIVTYFPVDSRFLNPKWFDNFDIVSKIVAYTSFGKSEVISALLEKDKDTDWTEKVKVIPHGNDPDVFYKLEGTKKEIKSNLFPKSEDVWESFIVLNANRNSPRKRIDISAEAFGLFAEDKPENVKYYHHAGVIDVGYDIIRLSRRYGFESRLILTNMHNGVQAISEPELNLIYNGTDLGLNTTMGEGWGLTNTEHASVGVPQVVPDHSACGELFYDCGWLVPTVVDFTFHQTMTTGEIVRAEDVAEKLEEAYSNKELYKELSEAGYNKFNSEKYSWKTIANQWDQLFESCL
jgi:D-inositol-3-phosphate glycosyltransferase